MKKYGGKRWFYAKGCRDRDLGREPDLWMMMRLKSAYYPLMPVWAREAYHFGSIGYANFAMRPNRGARLCNCDKCASARQLIAFELKDIEAWEKDNKMRVCQICGDKRCPKASDHHLLCLYSHENCMKERCKDCGAELTKEELAHYVHQCNQCAGLIPAG